MKHTAQSGRSMVETIGVLAVMGVLTIGGIAGYNYGINKHRANQILQDIRLIYQEIKYPSAVRQVVETGEFPDMELDTLSSYEYSFTFPDLNDFIYDSTSETTPNLISVNVSGVPKTACDILLKTKPEYVLMLKANGQSVWSCDKSENELSYIFEITADSLDYGKCSVCTGEHCFDDDLNCPEGEYCYNDTCSPCARGYTKLDNDTCYKCNSIAGVNWRIPMTTENCHRCPNTLYGYRFHSGVTGCMACENVFVGTSEALCKERCGKIPNVFYVDGYCVSCSEFDYHPKASLDGCNKIKECRNDIIFYPKDANGTSTTGLCTKCDTKNADGTACECPTGQFWVFADGNHSFCRACINGGDPILSSKVECDKCPNRYYATSNNDRNGECKLCPTGQVKSADGRSCVDAPAE